MKKILVIRFSSIGDIILTTPVLRCLKNQTPCEIHYLTKAAYADMLSANPYIDKIHTLDYRITDTITKLKKENFDLIIDLHKNIRSIRMKTALRKPAFTFKKLNIQKWLMVRFKINCLPDIHIVDRYLKTVESLGVSNDGQGLDYFIPEHDWISAEHLPDGFMDEGFVAIATGSKHATKQIPVEKLLEICREINQNIVLLGDTADRNKVMPIENALGFKVFNACGVYNINQSASIVSHATCLICGDTGLMHIAAALKKKIIHVWGNTIPAFGMYPYLPEDKKALSHLFEVKGLSCRPCSKLGYASCPKKHFHCMMKQDYIRIIQEANRG